MLELWLRRYSLDASYQSESVLPPSSCTSFTHSCAVIIFSVIFGAPLLTPRDANLC